MFDILLGDLGRAKKGLELKFIERSVLPIEKAGFFLNVGSVLSIPIVEGRAYLPFWLNFIFFVLILNKLNTIPGPGPSLKESEDPGRFLLSEEEK